MLECDRAGLDPCSADYNLGDLRQLPNSPSVRFLIFKMGKSLSCKALGGSQGLMSIHEEYMAHSKNSEAP